MTDTLVQREEVVSPAGGTTSPRTPPRWRRGLVRAGAPVHRAAGPLLRPRPRLLMPGQVLSLLALVTLGLATHIGLTSHLMEARHQQIAYADYRTELAIGTAPVAQYDTEGRLLEFGTPVAVLKIPKLGIQQVVGEGTTSRVLADGPGHRRDTVLPGQPGSTVIMGRRLSYGGPFADISELSFGDRIVATTGQGRSVYRVTGIRRAGDPLPEPLEPTQGRLTLVTGDGPWWAPDAVVRVDALLESDPQPAPVRVLTSALLTPAEQVMAVDGNAVVPVLLWCQALLAVSIGVVWARARWGKRQAWVVGVPLLVVLSIAAADQASRLLPNLL